MKTAFMYSIISVTTLVGGCSRTQELPNNDPQKIAIEQFIMFIEKAREELRKVNEPLEEFSIGKEKYDVQNMKISYQFSSSKDNISSAILHLEIHTVLKNNYWWTYTFSYEYRDNKWNFNNVQCVQEVYEADGHKQYKLEPRLLDDDIVKSFTP